MTNTTHPLISMSYLPCEQNQESALKPTKFPEPEVNWVWKVCNPQSSTIKAEREHFFTHFFSSMWRKFLDNEKSCKLSISALAPPFHATKPRRAYVWNQKEQTTLFILSEVKLKVGLEPLIIENISNNLSIEPWSHTLTACLNAGKKNNEQRLSDMT